MPKGKLTERQKILRDFQQRLIDTGLVPAGTQRNQELKIDPKYQNVGAEYFVRNPELFGDPDEMLEAIQHHQAIPLEQWKEDHPGERQYKDARDDQNAYADSAVKSLWNLAVLLGTDNDNDLSSELGKLNRLDNVLDGSGNFTPYVVDEKTYQLGLAMREMVRNFSVYKSALEVKFTGAKILASSMVTREVKAKFDSMAKELPKRIATYETRRDFFKGKDASQLQQDLGDRKNARSEMLKTIQNLKNEMTAKNITNASTSSDDGLAKTAAQIADGNPEKTKRIQWLWNIDDFTRNHNIKIMNRMGMQSQQTSLVAKRKQGELLLQDIREVLAEFTAVEGALHLPEYLKAQNEYAQLVNAFNSYYKPEINNLVNDLQTEWKKIPILDPVAIKAILTNKKDMEKYFNDIQEDQKTLLKRLLPAENLMSDHAKAHQQAVDVLSNSEKLLAEGIPALAATDVETLGNEVAKAETYLQNLTTTKATLETQQRALTDKIKVLSEAYGEGDGSEVEVDDTERAARKALTETRMLLSDNQKILASVSEQQKTLPHTVETNKKRLTDMQAQGDIDALGKLITAGRTELADMKADLALKQDQLSAIPLLRAEDVKREQLKNDIAQHDQTLSEISQKEKRLSDVLNKLSGERNDIPYESIDFTALEKDLEITPDQIKEIKDLIMTDFVSMVTSFVSTVKWWGTPKLTADAVTTLVNEKLDILADTKSAEETARSVAKKAMEESKQILAGVKQDLSLSDAGLAEILSEQNEKTLDEECAKLQTSVGKDEERLEKLSSARDTLVQQQQIALEKEQRQQAIEKALEQNLLTLNHNVEQSFLHLSRIQFASSQILETQHKDPVSEYFLLLDSFRMWDSFRIKYQEQVDGLKQEAIKADINFDDDIKVIQNKLDSYISELGKKKNELIEFLMKEELLDEVLFLRERKDVLDLFEKQIHPHMKEFKFSDQSRIDFIERSQTTGLEAEAVVLNDQIADLKRDESIDDKDFQDYHENFRRFFDDIEKLTTKPVPATASPVQGK